MNLNKISFSGKEALNICSDDFKYNTLDHIYTEHNINISDRNSRLYQDKYNQYLVNGDYFISLKTAGTQYLLYFTKYNENNVCLFIDKKIAKGYKYPRMIFVRYRFDDEIFNNTLLEGELLKDKNGKWAFVIEDVHVFCNKQMSKYQNFIDRINTINKMMNDMYTQDSSIETIPLTVKKYFTYNDINYLKDIYIENINYNFQGVYFTPFLPKHPRLIFLTNFLETENKQNNKSVENKNRPKHEEYVLQKPNEDKFKMTLQKPDVIKDKYTFKITKTNSPGIFQLYCKKTGNIIKHSIARVNTIKCSKFIKEIFMDKSEETIYCSFDKQFKKWIPIEKSDEEIDNYNEIKYITDLN